MKLWIDARPRAQGRPIVGNRIARDPEAARRFKAAVRGAALEAWLDPATDSGIPVIEDGAVELRACFFLPRPKTRYRVRVPPGPAYPLVTTPDLDNLEKALADGLNGLAYADDCQVARTEMEAWVCGSAGYRFAEAGVGIEVLAWAPLRPSWLPMGEADGR